VPCRRLRPGLTRRSFEERARRYETQLESNGYEVTIAEGANGFFAGVLVIDDAEHRFGFLEENGSVTWLTGATGDLGGLGTAIAQNRTEEFDQEIAGLENVTVE
jgi:hypothetical protein